MAKKTYSKLKTNFDIGYQGAPEAVYVLAKTQGFVLEGNVLRDFN